MMAIALGRIRPVTVRADDAEQLARKTAKRLNQHARLGWHFKRWCQRTTRIAVFEEIYDGRLERLEVKAKVLRSKYPAALVRREQKWHKEREHFGLAAPLAVMHRSPYIAIFLACR